MRRKFKTSGNGKTIRPCHVCGSPVNFVLWQEETDSRNRRIFHWANPDGSHHVHDHVPAPDYDLASQADHLRDILRE